jgi:hypothetical protein
LRQQMAMPLRPHGGASLCRGGTDPRGGFDRVREGRSGRARPRSSGVGRVARNPLGCYAHVARCTADRLCGRGDNAFEQYSVCITVPASRYEGSARQRNALLERGGRTWTGWLVTDSPQDGRGRFKPRVTRTSGRGGQWRGDAGPGCDRTALIRREARSGPFLVPAARSQPAPVAR